eukprot:jgi/Mesvir1/24592/Mv21912-RA.1
MRVPRLRTATVARCLLCVTSASILVCAFFVLPLYWSQSAGRPDPAPALVWHGGAPPSRPVDELHTPAPGWPSPAGPDTDTGSAPPAPRWQVSRYSQPSAQARSVAAPKHSHKKRALPKKQRPHPRALAPAPAVKRASERVITSPTAQDARCNADLYTRGTWVPAPCGVSRNLGIGRKYPHAGNSSAEDGGDGTPTDAGNSSDGNSSNSNSNSSSSSSNSSGVTACRNESRCAGSACDWVVASEHCHLAPFDKHGFCEALAGRSLLLVGDSMTRIMLRSLKSLLGGVTTSEATEKPAMKPCVEEYRVCGGLVITFVRNDVLSPVADGAWAKYVKSPQVKAKSYWSVDKSCPWVRHLASHQVVVLNSGAHLVGRSDKAYTQEMGAALEYLARHYKGQVFYRTTPRGHPQCEDAPASPIPSYDRYLATHKGGGEYKKYHWDRIPGLNAIARTLMRRAHIPLLDVAHLTELRPDMHRPHAKDCLHYILPSVVDTWNWLLYNAMLGRIE